MAGVAYVLAWVVGLSAGGADPALSATGPEVVREVAAHVGGTELQFAIAEGATGVLLVVTVLAVAAAARARGARDRGLAVFAAAGVAAGVLSLAMAGLGVALAARVDGWSGTPERAKAAIDLVNRLDGPKMWLLAMTAVAGVAATPWLPRWHRVLGIALAVTLVVSGVAYLLLLQSWAWTAYVSGILLLVWVGSLGVLTYRADRAAVARRRSSSGRR